MQKPYLLKYMMTPKNHNVSNSLDWNKIEIDLMHQASKITLRGDAIKMIGNIRDEVRMLSIYEVEARRGKKGRAQRMLVKINEDIETVKDFILFGALIS